MQTHNNNLISCVLVSLVSREVVIKSVMIFCRILLCGACVVTNKSSRVAPPNSTFFNAFGHFQGLHVLRGWDKIILLFNAFFL